MAEGGGERIRLANPIPIAGGRVVASPFQFFLDGNDNIRLEGWNSATGAVLELHGRAITDTGETQAFREVLPLTADRMRNVRDVALVRGYILNMVAVVIGAQPTIGQTFARVSIIRGFSGATIVLGVLLQGYVTSQHGLGWPGSPIQNSRDAKPAPRFITGTTPAAGQEVNESVPTGAIWELQYFQVGLTPSAVVTDRYPRFAVRNGLTPVVYMPSSGSSPTGVVHWYAWMSTAAHDAATSPNIRTGPLPPTTSVGPGQTFGTDTFALQAGDQFAGVTYAVDEWLDVE